VKAFVKDVVRVPLASAWVNKVIRPLWTSDRLYLYNVQWSYTGICEKIINMGLSDASSVFGTQIVCVDYMSHRKLLSQTSVTWLNITNVILCLLLLQVLFSFHNGAIFLPSLNSVNFYRWYVRLRCNLDLRPFDLERLETIGCHMLKFCTKLQRN